MKVSNCISAILVGVTTTLQTTLASSECVDVVDNPNIELQLSAYKKTKSPLSVSAFKYGRYCGSSNTKDKQPCNNTDKACMIRDRCFGKAGDDVAKCKCRADFITNLAGSLHIGCDDSATGVGYEEFCGSFDLATRSNLCLFCKVLEGSETPDGCVDHVARNTCKAACSTLDEL